MLRRHSSRWSFDKIVQILNQDIMECVEKQENFDQQRWAPTRRNAKESDHFVFVILSALVTAFIICLDLFFYAYTYYDKIAQEPRWCNFVIGGALFVLSTIEWTAGLLTIALCVSKFLSYFPEIVQIRSIPIRDCISAVLVYLVTGFIYTISDLIMKSDAKGITKT